GLPRWPPLSTARAAFAASQRKQAVWAAGDCRLCGCAGERGAHAGRPRGRGGGGYRLGGWGGRRGGGRRRWLPLGRSAATIVSPRGGGSGCRRAARGPRPLGGRRPPWWAGAGGWGL